MKTKLRASDPVEIVDPIFLTPRPKIGREYKAALKRLLRAKVGSVREEDKPLLQAVMPTLIRAANDPLMPDPDRFYQDPEYSPDYNSVLRLVQQLRAWYGPRAHFHR
ncbi:uncharacterized protein ColSpa_04104 [Colletotrichum spaethianum]|uniref:Uncharacterized protein n=1 Tax=Colletotrichum spaethianum TaxID=700344 RepID=A0AA37LCP3_9PEZI|nr:uncharacterized protein ColSpa_04104 [Colletotrichum spaethianum]GKT43923.1 hypothetical protein ColSpa_04104 [Colletotrichum spaethianum]